MTRPFVWTAHSSEALACATALLSRWPDAPRLLLLLGPPGVGKTHLLRWTVDHAADRDPAFAILRTDGAGLVDELMSALRHGDPSVVHRKYGGAQLVIVDDLHVLSEKLRTQREIAEILKTAVGAGACVVCAASCRASSIPILVEALTKLPGARLIELRRPGAHDMSRVVAVLGRKEGLRLAPRNVAGIARRSRGDVRRAMGALHRLEFQQMLARTLAPTRRTRWSQ